MVVFKHFHALRTGETPVSRVRRFTTGLVAVLLATCSMTVAQTMPATLPSTLPTTGPTTQSATTQPASRPSARRETLPSAYAVLTTRSIFMKGRVPERLETITSDPFANSTTQPARKGEDMIVFNGVTDVDGTLAAFIEDTGQGKVSIYRQGDSIAQGKIVGISLDALEYQRSDGQTVKVSIGQTLSGGEAQPLSERSTTPATGGSSDTMSILERMRRQAGRK